MNDLHFAKPARIVIVATAAVVLTLAARQMRGIVSPVLLALFTTQAFGPIAGWLMRKGVPRTAAVIIVFLLIVLMGVGLILLLGASVLSLNSKLPTYQAQIDSLTASVQGFFSDLGVTFTGDMVSSQGVLKFVGGLISGIIDTLGSVGVLLFIVAFMLFEAFAFRPKVERALGKTNDFLSSTADYTADIRSYVFIKSWVGALVAVLETLVLLWIGVDFAVLWGVISFLMSFIPNVGFIISLIPPVIMALLEFGWETALVVAAMYLIVNTAVDNFITPRIMGRGLDLSPLIVFVSLMYWSFVFGAAGAFLSVPLTLMVKRLLLERYESTQPLAIIIGSAEGKKPPASAEGVAAAGEAPAGS